jgi:predicted lipase
VLAAAKKALSAYPAATKVVTVGHSLGAAIALIDAVYLKLHLSSSLKFYTYAYGMPRVRDPLFFPRRLHVLKLHIRFLMRSYRSASKILRITSMQTSPLCV